MEKAIYDSGEYRLIKEFSHKTVDPYEWAKYSKDQKNQKMKEVLHLSPPDEDLAKNDTTLPLRYDQIGVIPNLPSSALHQIWNYAIFLKKNADVVRVNDTKTALYCNNQHFEVSVYQSHFCT